VSLSYGKPILPHELGREDRRAHLSDKVQAAISEMLLAQ
jgi:hypothetical protein